MKPELKKNRPNLTDQKIRQFSRLSLENIIPKELLVDKELSYRVTSYLKEKADNLFWGTNEDHKKALHYSDTIITIGEARNDPCQKALGLLSRGNIHAISGKNLQEAWEASNESAGLFRRGGDTTGWACTLSSRLMICIELNKVNITITKAALLSLRKVDDETNVALIHFFYKSLAGGATKSRALQQAQLSVLQENPRMHPAFWGAFQLFGHTDPVNQVAR